MLPKILKNGNLFGNGENWMGTFKECGLPKISHSMEDYRGGGMLGPIKIDMGLEAIEFEFTLGGILRSALTGIGAVTHDANMLRFMGAYQSDLDGAVSACEVLMRGRYQELDRGTQKAGEADEHKYKAVCSYYEEWMDGVQLFQIDFSRSIYIVDGVDRYAEIRRALGLDW